jgi:ribosomal protein S8
LKIYSKLVAVLVILTLVIAVSSNSVIAKEEKVKKKEPFVLSIIALQDQDDTVVYVKLTDEYSNNVFPSKLAKVQLKYISNGEEIVHNVKDVSHQGHGIYYVEQFSSLFKGTKLSAKVVYKTEEKGSNEVLKGWTNVLLNSDIVVGQVRTPEQMKVGETFNISFPVSEINGDIGGTTLVKVKHGDDELYTTLVELAADEEVDINVPLTFDVEGNYELIITAADVYSDEYGMNIEDYDTASNTVTFSIVIEPSKASVPINYTMVYYLNLERNYTESIWISFYDASDYELPVLIGGTLDIKITGDNGVRKEFYYELNDNYMRPLANETGAFYDWYHNESQSQEDYLLDYRNNKEGTWLYSAFSRDNLFNYGNSNVSFTLEYHPNGTAPSNTVGKPLGLDNADSILIEVTLTNGSGDSWTVAHDVLRQFAWNCLFYFQVIFV